MKRTSGEDGQLRLPCTAGTNAQAALGKVDAILVGFTVTWTGSKLPVRSQAGTTSNSRTPRGKVASKSHRARYRCLCPREGLMGNFTKEFVLATPNRNNILGLVSVHSQDRLRRMFLSHD